MPNLSEKEVMRVFNRHKRKFMHILGTKATSDHQLNVVGRKFFPQFAGAFPQDTRIKSKPTRQFIILNVDTKEMGGSHWCAVLKNDKTYYVYDSFGRKARRLLPHFSKGKLIVNSDSDPEQFGDSQICGVLCMAWISTVDEIGIRNALKV
jgi:hypothetical protein